MIEIKSIGSDPNSTDKKILLFGWYKESQQKITYVRVDICLQTYSVFIRSDYCTIIETGVFKNMKGLLEYCQKKFNKNDYFQIQRLLFKGM